MKSRFLIIIAILVITIAFCCSGLYANNSQTLKNNSSNSVVGSGDGKDKTSLNDDVPKKAIYFLQKGFHSSFSLGFGKGLHKFQEGEVWKYGPVIKVFTDYWFNDYYALGMEIGYQYISGSGGQEPPLMDENNIFLLPYIKFGFPAKTNWKVFFEGGYGLYVASYPNITKEAPKGWNGPGRWGETFARFSPKIGIGLNIRINGFLETGMQMEYMWMNGHFYNGGPCPESFYNILVSPFIGYVF